MYEAKIRKKQKILDMENFSSKNLVNTRAKFGLRT